LLIPKKRINPEESVDFAGNTDLIQYTYARIQSILQANFDYSAKTETLELHEKEKNY
jgi:arginyl-tRNA synthetase